MNEFRLLVVEDDNQDLTVIRDTTKTYEEEKSRPIKLVECQSIEQAFELLDQSFDGAIIDLDINEDGDGGKKVINKIVDSYFRVPIAIYTGINDNWDESLSDKIMLVGLYDKYDSSAIVNILDRLWDIYNTGLTHILGGKGKIETTLNQVFLENIKPNIDTWISYWKGENDENGNSDGTERSLLRYTLYHILNLLEEIENDSDDGYHAEEVYLYPPILKNITTGSIIRDGNQQFVVLTPACDLVIKKDRAIKTERILFVEIEEESSIVKKALNCLKKIQDDDEKEEKRNKIHLDLTKNRYAFYYHWLPPVTFDLSNGDSLDFKSGFINFRKIEALSKKDFKNRFNEPFLQISPSFIKDIVSRFSTYYARQGQPEFHQEIIDSFIKRHSN